MNVTLFICVSCGILLNYLLNRMGLTFELLSNGFILTLFYLPQKNKRKIDLFLNNKMYSNSM